MPYTYKRPARPVRLVKLPGGDSVHVRGLTLAELRKVDAAVADDNTPPHLVNVRTVELVAVRALADADGNPAYPLASADDLAELAELFTPDQLDAVCVAAIGRGKDAAGNG